MKISKFLSEERLLEQAIAVLMETLGAVEIAHSIFAMSHAGLKAECISSLTRVCQPKEET